MSKRLNGLLGAVLLTSTLVSSVVAQSVSSGDGPRANRGNVITVSLPENGSVTFHPNGEFAVTLPGFATGGSGSGGANVTGAPPTGPSPNIDSSLTSFASELVYNARFCLTLVGIRCEPGTPPAGAFNYVSTRADIRWVAQQAARDIQRDILLPGMVLKSNPPEGLVNLPTYFWVDRATYSGQTYFQQVVLPDPWTVDWDYLVTRTVSSSCPPGGDPDATCTSTTRVQEHHHEDHLDVVNIILTLTPRQYTWTFGDDGRADFLDGGGIGVPYSPELLCCPSLVEHNYRQSSFRVFDQGGFPVHLEATWSATAMVHATRDGAAVLDETLALQDRVGNYAMRHQVRESQSVLVR